MAARAVVRRGHKRSALASREQALDGSPIERRTVGEHDDSMRHVFAERLEAAAQRRSRAELPVGARTSRVSRRAATVSSCAPATTTISSTPVCARASSTAGSSSRCFGRPYRVAAPAASTMAAITADYDVVSVACSISTVSVGCWLASPSLPIRSTTASPLTTWPTTA